MNTLEISDAKAEQLDQLESTSAKIIQDYLEGKRHGGDDIKIAAQMMQVVGKNRQTTTSREALRFNIISAITDDAKVLKQYAKMTQPRLNKLLKGKGGG